MSNLPPSMSSFSQHAADRVKTSLLLIGLSLFAAGCGGPDGQTPGVATAPVHVASPHPAPVDAGTPAAVAEAVSQTRAPLPLVECGAPSRRDQVEHIALGMSPEQAASAMKCFGEITSRNVTALPEDFFGDTMGRNPLYQVMTVHDETTVLLPPGYSNKEAYSARIRFVGPPLQQRAIEIHFSHQLMDRNLLVPTSKLLPSFESAFGPLQEVTRQGNDVRLARVDGGKPMDECLKGYSRGCGKTVDISYTLAPPGEGVSGYRIVLRDPLQGEELLKQSLTTNSGSYGSDLKGIVDADPVARDLIKCEQAYSGVSRRTAYLMVNNAIDGQQQSRIVQAAKQALETYRTTMLRMGVMPGTAQYSYEQVQEMTGDAQSIEPVLKALVKRCDEILSEQVFSLLPS